MKFMRFFSFLPYSIRHDVYFVYIYYFCVFVLLYFKLLKGLSKVLTVKFQTSTH
jgi:hypothetical protein